MPIYFSKLTNGFYDTTRIQYPSLPSDVVEITAEQHTTLLDQQSLGMEIISDANGFPINAERPQPSDSVLIDQCKTTAQELLRDTDWVEFPSVTDTNNSPHLTNFNEFLAYRLSLRRLWATPVTNPVFPTAPTAVWSA